MSRFVLFFKFLYNGYNLYLGPTIKYYGLCRHAYARERERDRTSLCYKYNENPAWLPIRYLV